MFKISFNNSESTLTKTLTNSYFWKEELNCDNSHIPHCCIIDDVKKKTV